MALSQQQSPGFPWLDDPHIFPPLHSQIMPLPSDAWDKRSSQNDMCFILVTSLPLGRGAAGVGQGGDRDKVGVGTLTQASRSGPVDRVVTQVGGPGQTGTLPYLTTQCPIHLTLCSSHGHKAQLVEGEPKTNVR